MPRLDVVILAAGLGSRLASQRPKCLNELPGGESILRQQIRNVRSALGDRADITVVTGFQCWAIMEHASDVRFAYNERFADTNTNRSLLRALEVTAGNPVVWMNGDVVFDERVLERLAGSLDSGVSAVAVNTSSVADEEVKYSLRDGFIDALSKEVPTRQALGEAVGVNCLTSADRLVVVERLRQCADGDYFEKALECAIATDDLHIAAVDVTDLYAVEVDTHEDLAAARAVYAAAVQGVQARRVSAPGDAKLEALQSS